VELNSSQRIIFNTGATYARSILGAGLILFSSRWVLNALGQIDFGLFNVVGSLIIFLTFLNSLMGSSVSRHFAYSLGQGTPEEVNRWFNTALGIHLFLAIGLIIACWPVGEFVVTNYLTIPANRLDVCIWVFRVSLGATFFSMISVPFVAMFTAKQHLAEVAIWGILQSTLTFVLALLLTHSPGDRLLFYSLGMALILTGIQIGQIIRALFLFNECTIDRRHLFDRSRFKEICSFAMWSMIGGLGLIFRNHGSAILINLFNGPRVNAAYGIALQVSNQTNQLSAAMMAAFSPEITASEGRGERERMLALALHVCKIGTLLVLLFTVPLVVEMDYVLKLWLHEPPEYTILFCQLILCTFLIDRLTSGYMLAVNAQGKIAVYQATVGVMLLLTLPLAWFFLEIGYPPTSVGIAFIITMTLSSFGRVLWVKHKFGLSVSSWVQSVIRPCIIVAGGAVLGAILPRWYLVESFNRLILVSALSCFSSLIFSWLFALDERERDILRRNVLPIVHKIISLGRGLVK
jgi:O-antigen/teichoic acid export membrane protein